MILPLNECPVLQADTCSSGGGVDIKSKSVKDKLEQHRFERCKAVHNPFDVSMTSITSSCSSDSSIFTNNTIRDGCFKGTSTLTRPNRKVHFAPLDTEHTITPLFEYATDLWWQKKELEKCRSQQYKLTKESPNTKDAIRSYIHAYIQAFDEVFQTTNNKPFNDMISSKLYEKIVDGCAEGYGGLEIYCDHKKRNEVRTHVMLTVQAYAYFCQNPRKGCPQKLVRKYSRSLSAADRYWALVIGNANAGR
jgi:hypothetical protein